MLKDNLIMLRGLKGLSQEAVAEAVGISRQAYAKWESGTTVPDIDKCSRLAALYGVSLDSLVKTETAEGLGVLPPAPAGKHIGGTVTLGDRGQLVIPKAARERFSLGSGSRLVVLWGEEGIALLPAETFEAKMRAILELTSQKKDD